MSRLHDRMRRWLSRISLSDRDYVFLYGAEPPDEAISLDCETTGLDVWTDEIVAVAAVRVSRNRVLTSERFEALVRPPSMPTAASIKVHQLRQRDVAGARPMHEVLPALLRFIGARPVVGYYIDFDMAMLDRYARLLLGTHLPNRRIEVSRLYYARRYGAAPPGSVVDLRFATMRSELGIPDLGQHDALADAVMAAMMFLQLRDLETRGVRLRRRREEDAATVVPVGG